MTTSDKLILAQTIILFLTGVVVFFYTWETHKIRKDAAKQNELIARQVEIMHNSLQFELGREQQASEPVFKWAGGSTFFASGINRAEKKCEFMNEGGAVTRLVIRADAGIDAKIIPDAHLSDGQTGRIEFYRQGASSIADVNFEIEYTTRLKKTSIQTFVLLAAGGIPVERKPMT